jgi:hypothetical protein
MNEVGIHPLIIQNKIKKKEKRTIRARRPPSKDKGEIPKVVN